MARKVSPAKLAQRGVERLFQELTDTSEAFADARNSIGPIEDLITEVNDAIEREHIQKHGPIEPDEDIAREILGREAGYLVGVQVGLRLRRAGV